MKERHVRVTQSGEEPYGQIILAGHHVISSDEPVEFGGQDSGPDPYELVLAGLGACTAITLRLYADRHAWPLKEVQVDLTHAQQPGADGTPKDHFDRILTFTGDLTADQRARLVDVAHRCPVSLTLQRAAEVTAREA